MTKTYRPPNWRDAQCCGTCKHWEWTYEGGGDCREHPLDWWKYCEGGEDGDYHPNSVYVCDKWEKKE